MKASVLIMATIYPALIKYTLCTVTKESIHVTSINLLQFLLMLSVCQSLHINVLILFNPFLFTKAQLTINSGSSCNFVPRTLANNFLV